MSGPNVIRDSYAMVNKLASQVEVSNGLWAEQML